MLYIYFRLIRFKTAFEYQALIALLDISIFKDMLTASGSVESNGTLAAKPRLRIELYSEILLACAVLAV